MMYIMLLAGMIVSALVFGKALEEFTPGRLVQVIQGAGIATLLLNAIAMWKQETRNPPRGRAPAPPDPSFAEAWERFCRGPHAVRRLAIVGIGTMAFGMADILLEPFGGQILGLTVAATTKLTALLAFGGLVGFWTASWILGRGADPYRVTWMGTLIGIPAFVCVIVAASTQVTELFLVGNFLIGFGGAIFGHATLTATMNQAPPKQAGLAMGAWGAVQATAAGLAMAASGALRDIVNMFDGARRGDWGFTDHALGYLTVYWVEIALLVVTVVAVWPLLHRRRASDDTEAAISSPERSGNVA